MEATLIDYMGDDLRVVNAARVSYNKESDWETEGVLREGDAKLIEYLAEHEHFSPFGHCFATFRIKAPIFVRAQLVKHEYLRMNEVSRRYVDTPPEFYWPSELRNKPKKGESKQGSHGKHTYSSAFLQDMRDVVRSAEMLYEDLIEECVCAEQARMILPQNTYTEWYWSGSLDAFANMCNLRLKKDTQAETRIIAEKISEQLGEVFPASWRALVNAE